MSGKGRQPRVKGNLKPTSSSRAADLLEGDMAAINAFKANPALAFSQLSRAAPSPRQSSKSTTPEANSRSSTPGPALDQIDGHLASQLKRLGKHDSKTKMRALFELKGYVAEHTWEDGLEGMMLAWPPLFRKHIFDPDRRVRAAVATVNAALVKSAGKRLAPNLKQLIGAWIASYFDPHREVAKTSKKAYETVFPESRRKEVFAYCMDELVDFAVDNIVNQTPETLSDPRFADAEEMKSKFEQVIGASFGILGLVIEEVESDKVVEAKAKFDEVLGSKKAMQFLASPATFIRRAVYRFIRSAMLGCPQLAQDSYLQLTQALVSNAFVDNDPTAHGDMWDAVLLTTKNYPQAWSEITAKGKKTPPVARLFAFLSSRCRMAPTISYPSILALLANLPADILDEPAFSSEFRGALWQGAAASDEAAAATKIGARAVQVESISLASALCECLSFLWQRSLKAAGPAGIDSVSKEAAQELDRLWHFYLQNGDVAEEMTGAFVALYCKIEVLAEKYGTVLMDKIWAQTSWFALKRLSGDSAAPVVHLVAQIRALDAKQHGPLVENAKKLVVAFCQLAAQSPDDQTAQGLIQTLAQHAPDVVFREGFADKFSVRLEKSGACDEAIDLVLSKAQYVMANTGSLAEAVASLDEFVRMPADSADDGNGTTLRLVTALLKALPGSQISRNGDFTSARLPSLDALIVSSIPSIPSCADDILSASFESPPSQLLQLYSQALQLSFCGTVLVSPQTVNVVFGWMESVFKMQYEIQWEDKKSKSSSLDSWIRTIHEVLSSWTALANDRMAGPRFVRFWLTRTDNNARSALGLLFDMALSSAHGETGPDSTLAGIAHARLYPQAKRAWLATESQLEKLHLGSELAHALSESISEDLGDLATLKNPSHLARLAHSVFARICPQDDTKAIKSLIRRWLLDELSWKGALQGDAQAVLGESALVDDYLGQTALGSAALSQAINEPLGAMSLSFHSLGQWSVASLASKGLNATDHQQRFDMYGLSRFARRAMFSVEFLQLSGGLVVLSDASNEALSTLILNMTLAYVLLRETLAAYKHDAEDSDSATSGSIGIVQLDDGDNALYARISAAAKMIEGTVSDILSLLVVHGFSLPKSQSGDDDNEEAVQIKIPHDSGRWLSTLVSRVLSTGDASLDNDVSDSVWDILIITCIARHRQAPQSQWARVLATLSEWCQWANPLNSADVEAAMAVPLSSDLPKILELPALVDLTTLVARSVSLRHACPQSPALRGTLIDLTGSLTRTINGKAASATSLSLKLVVALELLAELLPPQAGALDAASSTPKIMHILVAVSEILADSVASSTVSLALTLAALAVLERFSNCVPVIDDISAVGLVRQCLRWLNFAETLDNVEQQQAVLVSVACSVSSLARMSKNLVEDINSVGPVLRQIGDHLVSTCVVSERPVPEGVAAVTALVVNGFFDVPAFDTLYPVMISATPQLEMELLRLVLSSSDIVADVGEHIQSLVGLVSLAAKTLENLHVPHEEFGETIETDEYVRNTGFRLLASMLLVTRCADALAADYNRYEEMAEKLSNNQVLDSAMPWVCALLSIDGVSPMGGYEPRLWDPSEGLDWETWAAELQYNPSGDQLFRVLAHQIMYSLAWTFPATYRSWWSGLSAKLRATSQAVEQFTCKHISPLVVEREIARIRQQEADSSSVDADADVSDTEESWDVRVHAEKSTAVADILEEYDEATIKAGGTQVSMTYTVDDSTLEITVRVPASYPLSLPTIESMKRVAVTEKRWRSWLVAAQAQMSRNRRLDAVCAQLLGNVGAHFAGVEDCAICYSAVGALDNSLPTKQCKTCKHKFHRMCLFKWFSTSNQSSCPLCRNLF